MGESRNVSEANISFLSMKKIEHRKGRVGKISLSVTQITVKPYSGVAWGSVSAH